MAKVADYAEAGIPEYWIVNPLEGTIIVLTLEAGAYVAHSVFRRGEQASSKLLSGFTVDVDAAFDLRRGVRMVNSATPARLVS